MKTGLTITAALFALAAHSLADVELTREEASSIPGYDLDKLADKAALLEGKIVRLKFTYRSVDMTKKEDGSASGMLRIWRPRTGAIGSYYKYGSAYVTIPAEGLAWFMKVPTTEERATITVVAKIGKLKQGLPTAELLGREIKTDLKGSKIVW